MKIDPPSTQTPIAVIGIGCIFPDSPDAKAFLNLLMRGRSAISDPPETHRNLCDYFDPDPKRPDHIYCNRGGYLPKMDFDPSEFGIPPTALEATDTSQLMGLLVAKRALADAGYGDSGRIFDRSKTSVVLGVTGTQELVIPLGARLGHPIWRQALAEAGIPKETAESVVQRISDSYVSWQENSFPGLLGNVVAGRIANRLDLGGTNCVVDAACASSMSALHVALLELTTGRSDMVLTGGVDR
jgi:acyl transferase domain-containing protein